MTERIAIAMDLGGTKIKLGLVQDGKVLGMTQIDAYSDQGLRGRLPFVKLTIDKLLEEKNISTDQLSGVGVSIPGIVDSVQRKVLSIDKKYGDAPEIDFPAWAQQAWDLPIILENDARSALVGEWQYGHGKGVDNVVLMTLGTGVGTSAVIEGKVLRGKHFQAGCLGGHFTVNLSGGVCNCGNIGCVESESSSWSLEEKVKAQPMYSKSLLRVEPKIDFSVLFQWAEKKDHLAIQMRDQCLDVWSACAINLIHAYDPEVLLLGGGIMGSGAYIIPYLQSKINELAWTPWGKVEVRAASSFDSAALLGVGYLVFHQN
ncbi:ROK family protein [Rufibacter latericius]|uniref:ROK family protein n=1 Tax=Rufibacter latericius TaxID=2487040 RepID=A0A3M9MDJ9_9BACT|nr:ROK family protein [Rufibacter latericius]RNI22678.1 ROK family protein [Rufibacter latericius]